FEPVGDLVVNAALNLPGSGSGSCGGSATLGTIGTGNVTLSTSPIDVSSDSCGGGAVSVSADDTAMVSAEINADSNTPVGGGFIQLTADTLTVGGKLHANGGGGEVNLQACALTLGPTGQTLATGPNGFNLLQASGPMEVQGTMTATVANTLDYLDPAHLPVVQSSHVSPAAVIPPRHPAGASPLPRPDGPDVHHEHHQHDDRHGDQHDATNDHDGADDLVDARDRHPLHHRGRVDDHHGDGAAEHDDDGSG